MTKGWDNIDPGQVARDGIVGAIGGAIGQAVSNAVTSNLGKPLYNTNSTSSVSRTNSSASQNSSSNVKTADIRFTQTTASHNFSKGGRFSGKTIGEVSDMLRSGKKMFRLIILIEVRNC